MPQDRLPVPKKPTQVVGDTATPPQLLALAPDDPGVPGPALEGHSSPAPQREPSATLLRYVPQRLPGQDREPRVMRQLPLTSLISDMISLRHGLRDNAADYERARWPFPTPAGQAGGHLPSGRQLLLERDGFTFG